MTRLLIDGLENMIPHYATRIITVAGLVIDDKNNILVVKDRYKKDRGVKLPGGGLDQGEDIWRGVVREVKEETGIDTEFVGIITWWEHHKQKWDCSGIYFACLLRPLHSEIHLQESEIEECCWMPYDQFKSIAQNSCLQFFNGL